MNISLREVTRENFWPCILLKSMDYKGLHLFEEHVTSNAFSLAQAKVEPEWIPKAIYIDDQLVGFTMYGLEMKNHFYFITRLMIDYRFQGKGYGKAAMLLVIDELKSLGLKEIYTSFVPSNEGAKKLYTSIGFRFTGRDIEFGDEKEPLYCLTIND
ncbi:GNAT family N-acetyltransferase [Brevibacillus choshinensis]|uniref:GNAT family N-acetyltransferase n=1 Tax=Brevibacillus choshinensis TaxID=54911 RepID=A0ABX7FS28_BRECH|nr:GNAT family N-acetyltransferase [Brevibacillus choshinensis]QRG68442.1 GNAT family N-acetyltransferase [Brevibacillus choshinensis]